MSPADLDPRTPVVAGVGQAAERLDEPGYLCRSPADLAADAARAALADTGADPAAVAAAIHTVAGVRQFENSYPGARAPLGRSDNFPRSVAGRIGADPARAVLEVSGGQAPQHLVTEFAGVIAAGDSSVVLLAGAEALSTCGRYVKEVGRPDFTERVGGSLEDRSNTAVHLARLVVLPVLQAAPDPFGEVRPAHFFHISPHVDSASAPASKTTELSPAAMTPANSVTRCCGACPPLASKTARAGSAPTRRATERGKLSDRPSGARAPG